VLTRALWRPAITDSRIHCPSYRTMGWAKSRGPSGAPAAPRAVPGPITKASATADAIIEREPDWRTIGVPAN
jgi:hypothetical protein